MDALSLLAVAGFFALGNGLVLWQLNNVKTDLINRIDGVKADLINRIDGVKADLGNRVDGVKADLGNRVDGVKADLETHEKECAERNREAADRDRRLHTTLGGLIHAIEGRVPDPSA